MSQSEGKHRAKLVGAPTGSDLRKQLGRVVHAHGHVYSEALEHANEVRHQRKLAREHAQPAETP